MCKFDKVYTILQAKRAPHMKPNILFPLKVMTLIHFLWRLKARAAWGVKRVFHEREKSKFVLFSKFIARQSVKRA